MTIIAINGNESEYISRLLHMIAKTQRDIANQKAHASRCDSFCVDKTKEAACDFFDFISRVFVRCKYDEYFKDFDNNTRVRLSITPAAEISKIATGFGMEKANKWVKSITYSEVRVWVDRANPEYCNLPMPLKTWEDKLWYKLHIRKLRREQNNFIASP